MKYLNTIVVTLLLSSSVFAGIKDLQSDVDLFAGDFKLLSVQSDNSCEEELVSEINFYTARKNKLHVNINMYRPYESAEERRKTSERSHIARSFLNASNMEKDNTCLGFGLSGNAYLGMALSSGYETRVSYKKSKQKIKIKKFKVAGCGLTGKKKENEKTIKIEAADNVAVILITESEKDSDNEKNCYYQKVN